MNKEQVENIIKEMLMSGDIKIKTKLNHGASNRIVSTIEVYVGDEKVQESKDSYFLGWD